MGNQSQLSLLLTLSVEIFPQPLLAGSQLGVLGFLLFLLSDHLHPSLLSDNFLLLSLFFDLFQPSLRSPLFIRLHLFRLVLTFCHSDPLRRVLIETVWVAGLQQLSNHLIQILESLGFIGSFWTFLKFLWLLVSQPRILLNLIHLIHLIRLIHLIHLNFGTQTVSENL